MNRYLLYQQDMILSLLLVQSLQLIWSGCHMLMQDGIQVYMLLEK